MAGRLAGSRRGWLAGPALMVAALAVAVAAVILVLQPTLSANGALRPAGWAAAALLGSAFVSLQALGARAVAVHLRIARFPETTRGAPASNPEDHETS
jgi:hypothetical protein